MKRLFNIYKCNTDNMVDNKNFKVVVKELKDGAAN